MARPDRSTRAASSPPIEMNDHFAAVFFFEAQRLFKGVVVGFAGDECEVLVFDPGFRFVDDQSRCGIRHRLDAAEIIFMLGFYSIRYACTIQGANPARCQA